MPQKYGQTEKPARLSFYVILLLFPALVLLALEFGLRIFGFGRDIPLFVEQGAPPGFLQPNPNIIMRYFPKEKLAPNVSPDTVYFAKTKAPDSFRIFIQGGSTAAGFPFGRWGSLQGMLGQRFKRLYPNHKIEIINTAMSAVNSYSLLDFVDEIIEHKPDLVLVYAGHNEYLGVMGVGSTFASKGGRMATLLYLQLKELKLYQLFEHIFYLIFSPNVDVQGERRSLMSEVAKGNEIVKDGPLYKMGLKQFEGNLSRILEKYQKAKIPVILGTLASNEKDQPPFSSIGGMDWENYKSRLQSINTEQEIAQLNNILVNSNDAAAWYKLGLLYLHVEEFKNARAAFTEARDHDLIRFRAPSAFNDVIKRQANRHQALVAESEALLRADSQDHLLGRQHMLEHLHPTARGYFLLAEAFVESFVSNGETLGFNASPETYPREFAWRDIPLTPLAKRYGKYKIETLTRDYPFTQDPKKLPAIDISTFEGKMLESRVNGTGWLSLQQTLLMHYQQQQNLTEAARVAGTLSDALVTNHQAAFAAGGLYRTLGDLPMAIYYQRRSLALQPDNVGYHLNLAQSYYMVGKRDVSLDLLDAALVLEPRNTSARFFHDKLTKEKQP